MRWPLKRPARYEQQVAAIQDRYRLAEVQRERLALLGRHALDDAEALTAREAALTQLPPASAERYQYLVDATTRALGDIITGLARSWAELG